MASEEPDGESGGVGEGASDGVPDTVGLGQEMVWLRVIEWG